MESTIMSFTKSEMNVMRFLMDGLTNKEIALKLNLKESTIKKYISRVLTKLQLRDRTQLALFILKNEIDVYK